MNSSVARFVALLVLIAATCFPDAAHARRDWVTCPVWNANGFGGIWPSPEAAAREGWRELGAENCPGAALVCTGPYENPAAYGCLWTYPSNPLCPIGTSNGMGIIYPAPPSPFPGAPGTAAEPVNNHGHCATFLPEDPKNNGHCDECKGKCPGCVGNPVNIGTGNKFQEEVDLGSAGPGGIEFTRYYNSRGGSGGSDFALN